MSDAVIVGVDHFPPIRSIVALPGKNAEVFEVSASRKAICQQLCCEKLDCIGNNSAEGAINIYYDSDAKKKGLPFNRELYGIHYYGPMLINGMYAEDRALSDAEIKNLLRRLNSPAVRRETIQRNMERKKKGGNAR